MIQRVAFFFAVISLSGCATTWGERQAFVDKVDATPKLSVVNPSADQSGGDVIVPAANTSEAGSGRDHVLVYETKMRLAKNLEQIIAFQPNSGVLFPGSLVHGDSLAGGILRPFPAPRNSQECTLTGLFGGKDAKFSAIYVPTIANTTSFLNTTLAQNLNADQPALMTAYQAKFNSMDEAALSLNADYHWMAGNASAAFSSRRADAKTRVMVRFVQTYFTVSCKAPDGRFTDLFPFWQTNWGQLTESIGPADPPAYIDSVTFGRELWMLLESSHTEAEIKAALDVAAHAPLGPGGRITMDAASKQVIDDSTIQAYAIGGSGRPVAPAILGDATAFATYVGEGANFSARSPGAPISYTVRYLKDNDLARVAATSDYVIKTTQKDPQPVRVKNVKVGWSTTDNDKDYNTQPQIRVYDSSGRQLEYWDCCSADKGSDHWSDHTSTSRQFSPKNGLTDRGLSGGTVVFMSSRQQNDKWQYQASITFVLDDDRTVTGSCEAKSEDHNTCTADPLTLH